MLPQFFAISRQFLLVILRASLALWQSYPFDHFTLTKRTHPPAGSSPPAGPFPSAFQPRLSSYPIARFFGCILCFTFVPSQVQSLLDNCTPAQFDALSPWFSPPVCYQLSWAGGLSLLRTHLPPHTTSSRPCVSTCLGLPLCRMMPGFSG